MNKYIKFLPFISLLLIALSTGDEFLSFYYCIKMGLALVLIIVSVIFIAQFLRRKLKR